MYEKTTHDISVTAEPAYLEDQSEPDESRYVWAYRITIRNCGAQTVQLRSRYWRITDANGFTQEIEGEGVVGDQPVLRPGESYEYTSGTPLATPSGFMVGTYRMEKSDGGTFTIDIPAFSLDMPQLQAVVH
ncbi:MAG TPA: Co2+/Mg2+ efflux protein ApaG [Alphaproteobacteria bacterium]|jgi:ApaG protein